MAGQLTNGGYMDWGADIFELKEDHIKLLAGAYWNEDSNIEYGALEQDPKRPYGNSGDVSIVEDMLNIIGRPVVSHDDDNYDTWYDNVMESADAQYVEQLHRELYKAIDIITKNRTFEPGVYTKEDYRSEWVLSTNTFTIQYEDEYDTCVICGVETQYKTTDHIDNRTNYTVGAGQVCDSCGVGLQQD